MKIKKSLVGLAIAGSLAIGFAGVAGAQTSSGDLAAPATRTLNCETAPGRLAKAQERIDTANARFAKAEARIEQLRSNGHTERADKLAARIAQAEERLAKAETRLGEVTAKVAAHCADPGASAASNAAA
jgi:hypothetical protein